MKAFLASRRFFREGHVWHGLQLVGSIALAYAATLALSLPEGQWAVMSALIVGRSDAGATLGAGWQRLGATIFGALVGVAGAALMQVQLAPPALVTLALVAALAMATADRIGWRSASIAALIVMGAAGRPGVSALAVAALRTLEVGLGACAAMAMAWLANHLSTTTRPIAVVVELLGQLAKQVEDAVNADAVTRLARSAEVRATQRRLGEMVHGTQDTNRRRLLLLAMRLAQDTGWMARQLSEPAGLGVSQASSAAASVSAALRAVAAHLDASEGDPSAALAGLNALIGSSWRADAVQVLQADLRKLAQVARAF